MTTRTKTGKFYFKSKFFGGFDLYIEERIEDMVPRLINVVFKYRKGSLSDLGELGIMHDNMKSKFK